MSVVSDFHGSDRYNKDTVVSCQVLQFFKGDTVCMHSTLMNTCMM